MGDDKSSVLTHTVFIPKLREKKMQFQILNLKDIHSKYNNQEHKILNKIFALSAEDLKALHDANTHYEQMLPVSAGERSHEWHLDQKQWENFKKFCKSQERALQLKMLKTLWQSRQNYSDYTSCVLNETVTKILPVFENYLERLSLKSEKYSHALSPSIKLEIKNYIKKLEDTIQREKENIIASMLARLKVASIHQDLYFDDVTQHVVWELHRMRLLKVDLPRDKPISSDPSTILAFQDYILTQGTNEQKQQLINLAWNKAETSNKNESSLDILNKIKSLPSKATFFQRILGMTQRCKKLIATKKELIVTLRIKPTPLKVEFSLETFYDNKRWKKLCELSQSTSKERAPSNVAKLVNFVEKLFYKETLLDTWQVYLKGEQASIFSLALDYLKKVNEQLASKLEGLDLDVLDKETFKEDLKKFEQDVLKLLDHAGIAKESVPAYQEFSKLYKDVIDLPNKRKEAEQEHIKEQYGKLKNISEFIDWSQSIDQKKHNVTLDKTKYDKNTPQGHQDNSSIQADELDEEEILNDIVVSLSEMVHNKDRIDISHLDAQEAIGEILTTIKSFGTFNEALFTASHKELCSKLFKEYLITWVNAEEKEKEILSAQFKSLESVFNAIAPQFIRERLADLINARSTDNWFIFQVRCRGFLVGFSDKEEVSNNLVDTKPTNAKFNPASSDFFKQNKHQNNLSILAKENLFNQTGETHANNRSIAL